MTRWATTLALLAILASPSASAEPPHDKHHKQDKAHGQKQSSFEQAGNHRGSPDIREAIIREILREAGFHNSDTQALPPGIRKNLQRGKPLPPGIAKKLDPSLRNRLPDYEGYEWRQVGRDLILVAVTTGIVEAILNEVF